VERGRTKDSVCEQFIETVAPMHKKFVQQQVGYADVVLAGTFSDEDVKALARRIAGWPQKGTRKISNFRFQRGAGGEHVTESKSEKRREKKEEAGSRTSRSRT
jgi:aminoglycoside phosphotransferase family enzyme